MNFSRLCQITNNNLFLSSFLFNNLNSNFYLFCYKKKYDLFNSKEYQVFFTSHKTFLFFNSVYLNHHLNLQNKLFTDLATSDFLGRKQRFNLTYNFLSLIYHSRFLLNIWNNELDFVPSITSYFPCAEWYERESWDLFGVAFKGNKDLRRILTDYGFFGHPLRKDFPLTGYVELGYDIRVNSIVYKNVTLIQEYREFDTLSPWDFFIKDKPVYPK